MANINLRDFMKNRITKGENILKNKGNLFFIYGKAGGGKTTFCQNIGNNKNVLFISTESGNTDKYLGDNVSVVDINRQIAEYIEEYKKESPNVIFEEQDIIELKIYMIETALEIAFEKRNEYDAIILDSMTDIINIYYYNRDYYIKKAYIERTGDVELKRYKENKYAIFEAIVKELFKIVQQFKSAGVDFVMIFLEVLDDAELIPAMKGQAYKKDIAGYPDFLFYVENSLGTHNVYVKNGVNSIGIPYNAKTRRDALNEYTPKELCNMGLGGVLEII